MHGEYQRLVVPVDGTARDVRVLEVVSHLIHKHTVSITLIYVVEVLQSMPLDAELPAQLDEGEAILSRAADIARHGPGHKIEDVVTELLQARSAGAAIVDEAIERNADAIVMATVNHHKHGRTTIGETVAYVLKNAPCEVVIVRQALPRGRQEGQRWE